MATSTENTVNPGVGFVVDADPSLGYGHAVRCLRIASRLRREVGVVFYPLSETCRSFVRSNGFETRSDEPFPPLVITDLRQPNGITADIKSGGATHVSIHDLGLAQCYSDVVIDGSITNLFPYTPDDRRKMFVGPEYMVISPSPRKRTTSENVVLITLGGGVDAVVTRALAEGFAGLGVEVYATKGFEKDPEASRVGDPLQHIRWIQSESEINNVVSRCALAVSGAGVSLYEMMAAGVPTVAVSADCLQLRTAEAFERSGAAVSAGLIDKLKPAELAERALELIQNPSLRRRLAALGQKLVDGKGLFRVTEIIRSELCLTT